MRRQPERMIVSALAAWMGVLGILLVIATANLIVAQRRLPTVQAAVRSAHPIVATRVIRHGSARPANRHESASRRPSAGRWSYVKREVDRCLRAYDAFMNAARRSTARSRHALAERAHATGAMCGQVAHTTGAVYRHGAAGSHVEILWLSRLAQTVTIDMQRFHRAVLSHRSWRQTSTDIGRLTRNFTPVATYRAREGRWLRRLGAS